MRLNHFRCAAILVYGFLVSAPAHAWFQVVDSWDITKATIKRSESLAENRLSNIMSEKNDGRPTPIPEKPQQTSLSVDTAKTPAIEFVGSTGLVSPDAQAKLATDPRAGMGGDFMISQ